MQGFWLLLLLHGAMCSKNVNVPRIKLNDGHEMPAIGLGTYLGFDKNGIVGPKSNELRDLILQALDVGYRHFDTAAIYSTEQAVGEAVRMKVDQGGVRRDEVFVTSKLWNTHHRRAQVMEAVRDSLNKTGLNYLDLYLMHWPVGLNEDYTFSDVDYMETWRGLEDAQKLGLVKSIGVSNFNKGQMQRLIAEGSVKPAVLQTEVQPQLIETDLISYCKSQGILVTGYSPFGALVRRYGMELTGPKFDDPVFVNLGKKYGKTSAQIVLRWLVDRNVVPIPKTITPKRLEENINIFDFNLQPDEIEQINKFNSNTRLTVPSFWQTHPYYPFEKVANPIESPFKGW